MFITYYNFFFNTNAQKAQKILLLQITTNID